MNRNLKISIAVSGVIIAFLVLSTVTASQRAPNTPLYTFRIEQTSCRMNFSSTSMNSFAYDTRNGCTLNFGFVTDSGVIRVFGGAGTCWRYPDCYSYAISCETCFHYTCYSCRYTCPPLCQREPEKRTCSIANPCRGIPLDRIGNSARREDCGIEAKNGMEESFIA